MSKDNTSNCPKCGAIIEADPFSDEGELISCLHCSAELKITNVYPLKVKMIKMANKKIADDYMEYIEDENDIPLDQDY